MRFADRSITAIGAIPARAAGISLAHSLLQAAECAIHAPGDPFSSPAPYSCGSAVVYSDAGVGSVSVVLSGCVGAGAVAESSGVVVSLSAGELLGVVGAVGVVGTVGSVDGSVVTVLSGVWVLLCCEPVAGISQSFLIKFALSLTAQLPHLGVIVSLAFSLP